MDAFSFATYRSVAITLGTALLVGGLVYAWASGGHSSRDYSGAAFVAGIGAAGVAWGLTAGWLYAQVAPRNPGRAFEVIPSAKEAEHRD